MSVSIEKTGTFSRKVIIEIPAAEISVFESSKLQDYTQKIKVDGFRAGKVPLSLVRKRYGKQIRSEVINDIMQDKFAGVLKENNLTPIEQPQVENMQEDDATGVTFSCVFEVSPEVELVDFKNIKLNRTLAKITEDEYTAQLTKLQHELGILEDLAEGTSAIDTDTLVIDFTGYIDGEPFENGSASDFELVLGSKSLIEGFEAGLIGAKQDDSLELALNFPEEYHVKELAGKPVLFKVDVKLVKRVQPAPVDAEFAKKLGIEDGDIAKIREKIEQGMLEHVAKVNLNNMRGKVLDELVASHPMELPERMLANYEKSIEEGQENPANNSEVELSPQEKARRTAILDLLRQKIASDYDLKLDPKKIQEKIMDVANMFGNQELIFKMYLENESLMNQIRTLVMDEAITELVLANADVVDNEVSFTEFEKSTGISS